MCEISTPLSAPEQLPCCVLKSLFPWSHPTLLAVRLFLPSLMQESPSIKRPWCECLRAVHFAVLYSVYFVNSPSLQIKTFTLLSQTCILKNMGCLSLAFESFLLFSYEKSLAIQCMFIGHSKYNWLGNLSSSRYSESHDTIRFYFSNLVGKCA